MKYLIEIYIVLLFIVISELLSSYVYNWNNSLFIISWSDTKSNLHTTWSWFRDMVTTSFKYNPVLIKLIIFCPPLYVVACMFIPNLYACTCGAKYLRDGLFAWLTSHQTTLLFSRIEQTNHRQVLLFSQNKFAPTTTQMNKHKVYI